MHAAVADGVTASWDEEVPGVPACDYVYVWVDGIHFNIRPEDDRLCKLMTIGVRAVGTKELVALEDGYRGSTESWSSVLRECRRRTRSSRRLRRAGCGSG